MFQIRVNFKYLVELDPRLPRIVMLISSQLKLMVGKVGCLVYLEELLVGRLFHKSGSSRSCHP